ncbi:von Willebrand factor D and EGF domain-containing protein-like [Saccoglossus kowalevskii]
MECNRGSCENLSRICAIAVREGNDVAFVDNCDDLMTYYVHRDPLYCNPAFKLSISPNGREVRIQTGSGQLVRYSGVNVYIDFNEALYVSIEGLCGSFDGNKTNDLYYVDSNTGDIIRNTDADTFAKTFELDKGTSLFYEENLPTANPDLSSRYHTCQCLVEDPDKPEDGNIFCGSYSEPIQGYDDGTEYFTCEKLHQRAINASSIKTYTDDYAVYKSMFSRHRPDTPVNVYNADSLPTWPTPSGITEEEAMQACHDAIYQSNIIEYCEQVVGLSEDIDNVLVDCKFDIQVMDDTSCSVNARSVLESSCLSVVYKNTSLWVMNGEGKLAPPEYIVGATCPAHCADNGNCTIEGVCICEKGFTSVDCSIEADKAPIVYEIYSGSVCDMRSRSCSRITVAALGIFDSGHLSCHIHEFEYNTDTGTLIDTGVVAATFTDFMSAYHMTCYLPVTYVNMSLKSSKEPLTSAIHAFGISVSNDGVNESNMLYFILYDSVCVNCPEDGLCTQRKDACQIDGRCYSAGEISYFNDCLVCDPDNSISVWTYHSDVCPILSTTKTATSLSTSIRIPGVVEESTTVNVVVILIVFCICNILVTLTVIAVVRKKKAMNNRVDPALKLGDNGLQ